MDAITARALRSVEGAASPRARQVSEALIRHLHAFVREVAPTEQEWMAGIAFLTRTGQMCSDSRQEYILLSDVLGVSMIVDAINNRLPAEATETTVFGPFYVPPPSFPSGADMRGDLAGASLFISGVVRAADGSPIADATIDIWHADAEGFYDVQKQHDRPGLAARGRFRSTADGGFSLWTVRPTAYPIPDDGPVGDLLKLQGRHPYRPEHVHFMVSAPGYRKLVTHLFAAGDPYLDSDVVFGVKPSLIRPIVVHPAGPGPDGGMRTGPWHELRADVVLAPE
ncbi:hydroxyquinol 1,2-dioxygenase [Sphingomonas taxi]|uniref:Hydroxyquinol 1,2-dioxygenase n=2 Tax=Sphingomonas taxi TaxID=1549858 RepID=A0A097EL81_9SPHN|nr:hydroxyquinol 1,2-dioxygenase [Sphingomonas taxi]